MSTKSTLASDTSSEVGDWYLQEEMLDDTVHLSTRADYTAHPGVVTVELLPAVLDAIARLHAAKHLPHQRRPEPKEPPCQP